MASVQETTSPAALWLSQQSGEALWGALGKQGAASPTPTINTAAWANGISAEDAWRAIGQQTPAKPAATPPPAEYPQSINPLAIVRASDDAWKHLSDGHPWASTKPAATKAGEEETLTVGDAAWRLAKAGILQHGLLFIPPASTIEKTALDLGENLINKNFGTHIDLEVPSTPAIAAAISKIKQRYLDINPAFVFSNRGQARLTDLEKDIVTKAEELAKAVKQGHLDHAYPLTPEEKALAAHLLQLEKMGKPQDTLMKELDLAVLAAAGDIAEQSQANALFEQFKTMGTALDELALQTEPETMFVTDLVTNKIVLTDHEEELHRNRVWGLTNTSLVIRDITKKQDDLPLPLSLLTTNKSAVPGGYLMSIGTPSAVDTIRKKGGALLQNSLYKWLTGFNVGGKIIFYSLERNQIIGEIMVNNPRDTMSLLGNLADTIRRTNKIVAESQQTVQKQETGLAKMFIRPKIVLDEKERMGKHAENMIALTTAVASKQRTLDALNNLYTAAKKAGRATIQAGQAIFQDHQAQQQAELLQRQLAKDVADEETAKKRLETPQLGPGSV